MSTERHATEDLPAYALGALGEAERDIVAAHVDRCAQCTRDLAQFEDALYEAAAIGAVQARPRQRCGGRGRRNAPNGRRRDLGAGAAFGCAHALRQDRGARVAMTG